jgi:hypothetical protein
VACLSESQQQVRREFDDLRSALMDAHINARKARFDATVSDSNILQAPDVFLFLIRLTKVLLLWHAYIPNAVIY